MSNIILEIKDGSFYYSKEKFIFDHINFELGEGEIMAVMGKNGIGKTTLLKCIIGLLQWTDGYSAINGKIIDFKSLNQVGYVPQAHKTSFSYTVFEMVLFGKIGHNSYFANPKTQDYEEVEKVLVRMGISELRDKPCNELSGGQLQRFGLLLALIKDAKLIILDEPTTGIDSKFSITLYELLKDLSRNGKTIIMVTHNLSDAKKYADRVFEIKDGVIGGVNA